MKKYILLLLIGLCFSEWNAEGLPSSVYFVKLDAGEFTKTHKLMLVK